eukprot:338676-Rhodomonas_salina.2
MLGGCWEAVSPDALVLEWGVLLSVWGLVGGCLHQLTWRCCGVGGCSDQHGLSAALAPARGAPQRHRRLREAPPRGASPSFPLPLALALALPRPSSLVPLPFVSPPTLLPPSRHSSLSPLALPLRSSISPPLPAVTLSLPFSLDLSASPLHLCLYIPPSAHFPPSAVPRRPLPQRSATC